MSHYSPAVAIQMIRFYNTLNERDRRRYAAVEAVKLGHAGTAFISKLLNCDPKTISRGISELESEEQLNSVSVRQRKKGADENL
ncbi:hypothetical protein [Endozoicomonas euniceicola]|uniref:Uncharacterized protein n=1 Tax=Endozoicomonas euniceicola TaxID=1234143 RepID=A0ABY6GWG8_9GAMM|nr:hypothetical protein [Endozoicomonas euniceicola]UYM16324.1 hypothetical protein NX720_26615 [Endozoicomonas euniceicola]